MEELRLLLATHRKYWFLIDVSVTFVGTVFILINDYVFSPASGVLLLEVFIVSDFITGYLVSKKKGEKFSTDKFKRTIISLAFYPFILALATMTSKTITPATDLFGDFGSGFGQILPFIVYFPIVTMFFLSIIKNASLLGYINPKIARVLYKNIDTYKNKGFRMINNKIELDDKEE